MNVTYHGQVYVVRSPRDIVHLVQSLRRTAA